MVIVNHQASSGGADIDASSTKAVQHVPTIAKLLTQAAAVGVT
jgi:hypothetical protein